MKFQLTRVSPLLMVVWITAGSSNVTCNNRCQLHDSDSECWSKARSYYISQVIKSINELAAVEVMIGIWETHHENHLESLNSTLTSTLSSNQGPLPQTDIISVFKVIQNKTAALSSSTNVNGVSISCPTPCDYVNTLWIYLFVCSCIIVLLTIPIVAVHLYFSRKNNIKYQLSS